MATQKQQIEELTATVEQYRRELTVKRVKLSKCAEDMIGFIQKEMAEDPFLSKIPAATNPFRERSNPCEIL